MESKNTCSGISDQELGSKKKKTKKSKNNDVRSKPNILVTGTPGTGKTTLCKKLQEKRPNLKWINVGEFAKTNNCLGDWDSQYECHDIDEDKLIDDLEDAMAEGNVVLEHHVTDIFPERWFDAVFVLRTDNTQLFDRLQSRNYNEKKLDDNVQCEIFQTILDEARDSYKAEIVHEIRSDVIEDVDKNTNNISLWIDNWISNNS